MKGTNGRKAGSKGRPSRLAASKPRQAAFLQSRRPLEIEGGPKAGGVDKKKKTKRKRKEENERRNE